MREQSSAIVLAVGKDGLVRSADIAVVLGTGMLEGGAEWNEEAEKREESGWGAWVAEGRERALGAGGGGSPRLSSGPGSGNRTPTW